jgi:Fe-S-cluster containining protein
MKTLPQKAKAVQRVFDRLDKEIATVQKSSGLHCLAGCGECCKKADIEATPLEFLPLALQLLDEGRAEKSLEELESKQDSLCFVFRPHVTNFGGLCNEYPNRGLICRLFGFTARRNKEGMSELVTCKLIKQEQSEAFDQLVTEMKSGKKIPVMSDYYSRIASIDHTLVTFYPINEAIKQALETVLHYYAYRKRRKPRSKK